MGEFNSSPPQLIINKEKDMALGKFRILKVAKPRGKMVSVRAIADGFYDQYRKAGDTFMVDSKLFNAPEGDWPTWFGTEAQIKQLERQQDEGEAESEEAEAAPVDSSVRRAPVAQVDSSVGKAPVEAEKELVLEDEELTK